ncbi:ATP-binding cassette domain-containing protein [Verrucomicrobia bacterium]|nr:ATP-binding cassette domain-containing protein [Verrucomicrobiota bacterium]MDB4458958.1 ATP-binding cassette domain-containing protein [bacterium]
MANDLGTTLVSADEVSVQFNDHTVLSGATLSVVEGQRVGLVGRNGCGKSTFLKLLIGELAPSDGNIARKRGMRMGYLSQNFTLDPEKNVRDNIISGAADVQALLDEFESPDVTDERHEQLEELIHACDAWGLDSRVETVMSHLHTPPGDAMIEGLSGGEMRRIAMARALVGQPELLILDEPTNHLDPDSIEWLGDFLLSYKGAFLVVTHDRYFLDKVTNNIVELANGRFYVYSGNYSDFLIAKSQRLATEANTERNRQRFLEKELDWASRQPKARTTKSKSRLDRIDLVQNQGPPEAEVDMELVIPPPPQLGNRIVDLHNLGLSFGDRTLIKGLDFSFERGMKIGVAGPNGAGKTTLIRLIMETMKPTEGTAKSGSLTDFNYVDQSRIQLDDSKTVLEEASDGSETIAFGNGRLSVRAYLKRFLFDDTRIGSKVELLSGGERSRLMLAKVLKCGGNFLILDEPTNDLDLASLRILEEALIAFPGVVLVVSHDRYFLNRVCNGVLAFEDNARVAYSLGNYDYYIEKKQRAEADKAKALKAAKAAPVKSKAASGKKRKLTWNEQNELDGMDDGIMKMESEIEAIEIRFTEPGFHEKHGHRLKEIQQDLDQKKKELAKTYVRWEELEALK